MDDLCDRRRSHRAQVSTAVRLYTRAGDASGEVLDLSLHGAGIKLAQALEHDACIVAIPFGRDPVEALALLGRVVRRHDGGIGLRWTQPLPFDARFKIHRLMELELGTPYVLEQPLPMLRWPAVRARAR